MRTRTCARTRTRTHVRMYVRTMGGRLALHGLDFAGPHIRATAPQVVEQWRTTVKEARRRPNVIVIMMESCGAKQAYLDCIWAVFRLYLDYI